MIAEGSTSYSACFAKLLIGSCLDKWAVSPQLLRAPTVGHRCWYRDLGLRFLTPTKGERPTWGDSQAVILMVCVLFPPLSMVSMPTESSHQGQRLSALEPPEPLSSPLLQTLDGRFLRLLGRGRLDSMGPRNAEVALAGEG